MKLKKGPWTREEDQKLLSYIAKHGHGSWRILPAKAGLQRCGKSCRLRWTNYLRPDIKRGKLSSQEEKTIIRLHALLGNRWSAIATHLPKRTDNEIKNYWNTRLKKRLTRMGIDPVTHKPKNNPGTSVQSSHMAQWETARLEAEARLVREAQIMSNLKLLRRTAVRPPPLAPTPPPHTPNVPYHDMIKIWQSAESWAASKPQKSTTAAGGLFGSSTMNFPLTPKVGFSSKGPPMMENAVAWDVASESRRENNKENPFDFDFNVSAPTDFEPLNNYTSDEWNMLDGGIQTFDEGRNFWDDLFNSANSPLEPPLFLGFP